MTARSSAPGIGSPDRPSSPTSSRATISITPNWRRFSAGVKRNFSAVPKARRYAAPAMSAGCAIWPWAWAMRLRASRCWKRWKHAASIPPSWCASMWNGRWRSIVCAVALSVTSSGRRARLGTLQLTQCFGVQGFLRQQTAGTTFKQPASRIKQAKAALERRLHQSLDFLVDDAGGAGRILGSMKQRLLTQIGIGFRLQRHMPEALGHAIAGDHGAGDVRGLEQVVGSSGGQMAEHQPFSSTPTQQHGHLVFQLLTGHQETILGGTLDGIAERPQATRNDRDLVHRIDTG